jgi:hypothetical protein
MGPIDKSMDLKLKLDLNSIKLSNKNDQSNL